MKRLLNFIFIIGVSFSLTACQGVMEDFFGDRPQDGEAPLPSNPTPAPAPALPGSSLKVNGLRVSAGRLKAISGSNYSSNLNVNHSRYGVKNGNVSARVSISTQTVR